MTVGRTYLHIYGAALAAAVGVASTDLLGLRSVAPAEQVPGLAWRLLAMAIVVAALAAGALWLTARASLFVVRRTRRPKLWPLPYVVFAAPAVIYVAIELFSGGTIRRIVGPAFGVPLATPLLLVGVYFACILARRLSRRVGRAHGRAAIVIALGAALVGGLALVNHRVLPGHYDYLHATLVVVSFGIAFVAASTWPRSRPQRFALGAMALVTAVALLGFVVGLSRGHALRATLHRPQAPASRVILAWFGGAVPAPAAPTVAAPPRVRVRSDDEGLPRWERAHVLLITIDALRADHLGAYGYERGLSPAIDQLAAEGVVFEHAYTQAPHSSYSISSIMASEYLHETLSLDQEPPVATLPRVLRRAGYRTVGLYPNGIFHTHGERLSAYRDTQFGFAVTDHRYHDAEAKTDAALAAIEQVRASGEPPSLVWVHYFDVHEPYTETSLGTSLVDRYDGEIRNVDRGVARLVSEARRRLTRDVIVLITADHGEELGDHGGLYHGSSLYEEQVRVPLIVNAPSLAPRRVEGAVELVDVAPTVLASLGVEVPASMRGDDLRGLLVGRDADLPPAMSGVGDRRGAFDGRWKLIADLRSGAFEVYDLASDPAERRNVADERPDELARLHGQLQEWLASLHDETLSPEERVLERARLGDDEAVPLLADLLHAPAIAAPLRVRAARALGELGGPIASRALARSLGDPEPAVAAEAAVALGELGDARARTALRGLLEDRAHRERAALTLARLGDRDAVPALIEVLEASADRTARERAASWLGRLGDPRGYDPLSAALAVPRVRRYAAEALGQLGDPRALPPLLELLGPESHLSVRIGAMRGLARLDDPRSAQALARLAVEAPEVLGSTEALVRVGALDEGAIGGVDFTREVRGARRCRVNQSAWDAELVGRTTCELSGAVELTMVAPPSAAAGYVLFVRGRAPSGDTPVIVQLDGGQVRTYVLGPRWSELRTDLGADELRQPTVRVEVPDGATVELDHVLLVPRVPTDVAGL